MYCNGKYVRMKQQQQQEKCEYWNCGWLMGAKGKSLGMIKKIIHNTQRHKDSDVRLGLGFCNRMNNEQQQRWRRQRQQQQQQQHIICA